MKFEKFDKIPRLSRDIVITEKIDGTNAQIYIINKQDLVMDLNGDIKMSSIIALHLKTSLLYYYRFKRGYLAVDECYSGCREKADILIDTGKSIFEVEIKLNKADLYKEKKKKKHKVDSFRGANNFYLCVPTELLEFTKKWIKEVNPKYGLIEFNTQYYTERKARYNITHWDKCLRFKIRAKQLHTEYNIRLRQNIIKRLPSALCNAYIDILEGIDQRETDKNE